MFCLTLRVQTTQRPHSTYGGAALSSRSTPPEGVVSLTKTALPKRPKEGAREWKGSIVSAAKSRLDDGDTPRRRPPPNKGATALKTKPCSVFSGRFLSPKNHVWKGKGELP